MVILEIGPLLDRVANAAHLCHPSSQFQAALTSDHIVRDVTVATGGRILFLVRPCLGMGSLQVTLVLLRMALFTSFVIVKERRHSLEEVWVGVFFPFFFDVRMALGTREMAVGRG